MIKGIKRRQDFSSQIHSREGSVRNGTQEMEWKQGRRDEEGVKYIFHFSRKHVPVGCTASRFVRSIFGSVDNLAETYSYVTASQYNKQYFILY